MSKCSAMGFVLLASAAACIGAMEPLTDIATIRGLTAEQWNQRLAVRLDAAVTFYHKDWGVLFIHDGRDGICVGVPEILRPAIPFALGERLHIEGIAGPGEFLPVVLPSRIEVTSRGEPTAFHRITGEELFVPSLDCAPVEMQAVVKGTAFMDQCLVVELQVDGWPVRALVPQHQQMEQLPWQLIERRVRARGVVGTHFNDQRQMSGRLLFVPGLDSFALEEDAPSEAAAPLVPVDGLLRVDAPLRQRLRVRGVATHVAPGRGLYVRGEGGSLFVQTAQPVKIERGDEIEAEGYPLVTPFRPSLSALDVKKISARENPQPVVFRPRDTRNSREQCELIVMDAEFLELTRSRETVSLVCRSDGEVFEALLTANQSTPEEISPGMKLRLTGICELITNRPLIIPRNATGFRILLRDPADIAVLARQPWWNERRAKWVLGALGVLIIAVGAWAVTLFAVVRSQSGVIRQQAQQQATLEERERIARDLHDTLEQELVGVTMLLDNTAMRLNGGQPEAAEPLGLARRLLRRAREESRSTIRELRSVALEQRGLPAAIEELLRPLATAGGAEFSVEFAGEPVRQAGTFETNLLRIAHEAVANAARHAQAKHITVRLGYEPQTVTLEVRDDGHGFDPEIASVEAGHFGLSGMKERAEKIGGSLLIDAAPGRGARISVSAPITSSHTPAPATA